MHSGLFAYILGLGLLTGVLTAAEKDLSKKYKDRVEKYGQSVLSSLNGASGAVEDLKDDAITNYDKILSSFVDGQKRLAEQMENARKKLLDSYEKNVEMLRENIKNNYNNYIKQGRTSFDGNVSNFKKYCDDVMQKLEGMGPYCQDAVDNLKNEGNTALITLKKLYNEAIEHFEKGNKEALKKSGTGTDTQTVETASEVHDEAMAF